MAVKRSGGFDRAITSTLNTIDSTKANANNVYKCVLTTIRYGFPISGTAGTYIFTLGSSAHTTEFWVYGTDNSLLYNFTTSAGTYTLASSSTISRVFAKTADANSTFTVVKQEFVTSTIGTAEKISSSGTYAPTSGGNVGNYVPGEYAVVLSTSGGGGGGGGGSNYSTGQDYNIGSSVGGAGGSGGFGTPTVIDTPFALTGTYTLAVGAGGNAGGPGSNVTYNQVGNNGQSGGAGGSTTGFTLNIAGGTGGTGGTRSNGAGQQINNQTYNTSPIASAAQGTPTTYATPATKIFSSYTSATTGGEKGAFGYGNLGLGASYAGGAGTAGSIWILRWTP